MVSSDNSWPDLTPPPINLWSLPYSFEQAAIRHPSLNTSRRQLMRHMEQMQHLLATEEEWTAQEEKADDSRDGLTEDGRTGGQA